MNLVYDPHPALYKVAENWDFDNPLMDAGELVYRMQKIRKANNGIGLAAPQVDLNTRVIVLGMGDDIEHAFFNPSYEIVESEGDEYMIEGCLSFPGLFVKVKRPETIELYWETEEGTGCDEKFDGITSRILQHEIDHLNGITFLKRANRFHLEQARKQMKLSARRKKKLDEEI